MIEYSADLRGIDQMLQWMEVETPRKLQMVMNQVAQEVKASVHAEAVHNLSGGMWNGGEYAVRRFHSRIRDAPKRHSISVSAGSDSGKTVYFWSTDPVSAIMEKGSRKSWTIQPRGVSKGWRSRRKYRDNRRKTRFGALHSLKMNIGGKEVFAKKVERKGLKRRPWISDPIKGQVKRMGSVFRRKIAGVF